MEESTGMEETTGMEKLLLVKWKTMAKEDELVNRTEEEMNEEQLNEDIGRVTGQNGRGQNVGRAAKRLELNSDVLGRPVLDPITSLTVAGQTGCLDALDMDCDDLSQSPRRSSRVSELFRQNLDHSISDSKVLTEALIGSNLVSKVLARCLAHFHLVQFRI